LQIADWQIADCRNEEAFVAFYKRDCRFLQPGVPFDNQVSHQSRSLADLEAKRVEPRSLARELLWPLRGRRKRPHPEHAIPGQGVSLMRRIAILLVAAFALVSGVSAHPAQVAPPLRTQPADIFSSSAACRHRANQPSHWMSMLLYRQ